MKLYEYGNPTQRPNNASLLLHMQEESRLERPGIFPRIIREFDDGPDEEPMVYRVRER